MNQFHLKNALNRKCTYMHQRKYSISSEKRKVQTSNKSLEFKEVQKLGISIA